MVEQTTEQRRRRSRLVVLIPLAMLASSAVVYQASSAAFTASTSNSANNWTTGTVALRDDDSSGAALFSTATAHIKPGDSGTNCISVTYSGTVAANVKLYATGYPGTGGNTALGSQIKLKIEEGTGGSKGNCTGFTPSSTIYNSSYDGTNADSGSLNDFNATHSGYDSGVSSWAPSGTASKVYRFTWSFPSTGTDTGDNALQNTAVSMSFKWEAHSA